MKYTAHILSQKPPICGTGSVKHIFTHTHTRNKHALFHYRILSHYYTCLQRQPSLSSTKQGLPIHSSLETRAIMRSRFLFLLRFAVLAHHALSHIQLHRNVPTARRALTRLCSISSPHHLYSFASPALYTITLVRWFFSFFCTPYIDM